MHSGNQVIYSVKFDTALIKSNRKRGKEVFFIGSYTMKQLFYGITGHRTSALGILTILTSPAPYAVISSS